MNTIDEHLISIQLKNYEETTRESLSVVKSNYDFIAGFDYEMYMYILIENQFKLFVKLGKILDIPKLIICYEIKITKIQNT